MSTAISTTVRAESSQAGLADTLATIMQWGGGIVAVIAIIAVGWLVVASRSRCGPRPPVLSLFIVATLSSVVAGTGLLLGGG